MTAKPPALARMWTGTVLPSRADAYEEYLQRTGVPEVRSTSGNLGVLLLRRDLPSETEFSVLSLWEDEEAIHRFAGDEIDKAVYFPEDRDFLLRMEPNVTHYRIRSFDLGA